ncbi:MAG TPA: MarR family transcriptional regulator [Aquamicrobium sp.]|nr:MarR family transcriptional regulator [Aquamicrobium sp.]
MDVGEQLAIELGRVHRQWRKRLDERLKETGLTQARWLVLLHLSRTGPISQRDLAELLGVEGPTLVRVLDRLEQQGLVERHASGEDRRVKRVHLADAARPVLAEIASIAAALRRELLANLADEELRTAWKVLKDIGDRLESV